MAAIAALGVLGTLIGSFLNVVVYRVPLGKSIVAPPSACGSCGHVVRAYDNIPLVSWLVLRGKCRDCAAPISARYPLVELGGAIAFGLVAWRFAPDVVGALTAGAVPGAIAGILVLVAFLYLAAIGLALALIDLDTRRLPNVLVLPMYVVGGVLFTATAAISGRWDLLATAAIGMAGLGLLYLVLAVVRPGGMGMGDVKLAGALGLFLGWLGPETLAVGAIAGFLLGGGAGVVLLLRGAGRKASLAFGPWLIAGAWVGILAGPVIATAYLGAFGLR
ncbi:prepilin peptidase [Pseudolysinimonas sp.]|jgi:leader peptidase (prepilin peptidase)/N-methyltransferase|uniref:prepilin peptidase n=1 Tax=Pseudolysinimonas sp. TaxID=2680009 RepID=UPI003783B3B9